MAEGVDSGPMRVRVADGTSPVLVLARSVAEAVVLIAPENIERATRLIAGLNLVITDDEQAYCAIDVAQKNVVLSRRMLEQLWCSAYAYWILYSRHVSGRLVDKHEVIDLTADPLTHDAMRLLTWSMNGGMERPWPATLPKPVRDPEHASDIHVANELMRCAVAFLLHHELSHYRLLHSRLPAGPDAIDQEREADYEAAQWVLAGCEGDVLKKRAIGVAIALIMLVAADVHGGPEPSGSHPRSFDRLMNTLRRHVSDPHHVAWGIAVIAIKLHLDHVGVVVPSGPFSSAQAAAEEFAEVLSRRP